MLDYAVNQYQKHGLSRRAVISVTASCIAHFLFFIALIEFPMLLEAGYYHQFHGVQRNSVEDDEKNWRTVALLESPKRMDMPSAATLKKYLSSEKKGSGAPPIRVNLRDLAEALAKLPPVSVTPQKNKDAKPPVSPNETAPVHPDAKLSPQATTSGTNQGDSANKGNGIAGSPQKAEPKVDIAANTAPSKIPDSIKPPAPPTITPGSNTKTPAGDKKSSQSSGIGIFDYPKGFDLGDYKDRIVERVKEKWFIPSNLKHSQGQTTLIFYIDKEGRCANLRITAPSGSKSLDLAALSAITESVPFPPLPKGFPGEHIGVKLILLVEP